MTDSTRTLDAERVADRKQIASPPSRGDLPSPARPSFRIAGNETGTISPEIVCPCCHDEQVAPIRLTAETSRRAARRRVTPEVVHLCPSCGTLLILSLHPASREAIGS
jgi:hypothetical protein